MHIDAAATMARELQELLALSVPPIALTFAGTEPPGTGPEGIARFGGTFPPPTADGRTGAVPAGCVFWMHATERAFSTVAGDHANCSVGSYTHGFHSLSEIVGNKDVAALLGDRWVTPEAAAMIETVPEKPAAIVYAPLAEAPTPPDVVLLRINAKQAMLLNDAWPELRFEGKPQCHIILLAMTRGEIAISTGCILSRVRTGMSNNELTCALPATRLPALLERLRRARPADLAVAAYAAEDARRFA